MKDDDAGRWDSAAGWDGSSREERRKKEKEQAAEWARAKDKFRDEREAAGAIEVRSLAEWASFNAQCTIHDAQFGDDAEEDSDPPTTSSPEAGATPPQGGGEPALELFPPFWYPGELGVLIGVSGVGKSRLALQIAMTLAQRTGSNHEITRTDTNEERSAVLYLDLERTGRMYGERYSAAEKSFANVDLGLLADVATPEKYRGKRHKFLLAAVNEQLRLGHRVVIVDNLTWLLKGESWEIRLLLKGFRRWVNETGNSMLLLWHSSPVQSLELQAARFDLAETIFAMKTSTMGENIRYVKSLKSPRKAASWKPFAQAPRFEMQSDVMLMRRNQIGGFDAIGPSPEIAHHHDYAAEILAAKCDLSRAKALLPASQSVAVGKEVKFSGID